MRASRQKTLIGCPQKQKREGVGRTMVNVECMKIRPLKRSVLVAFGLLLVLLAVPVSLTWRQAQLNRALLIAIGKNDIHCFCASFNPLKRRETNST
jgi:hypothetical protein